MAVYLQSDTGLDDEGLGSSIEFPLRTPIVIPSNIIAYVSLESFRYSNVFFNVDTYNNIFYYSLSNEIGTIYSLVVPPGNYTISSLLQYLNTELADSFMSFSYNSATFRITIENLTWGFIIRTGENSIAPNLGIPSETVQDITHTGANSVNLGGISVLNIGIPNFHINSNSVQGYRVSILDSILNDVLVGSTKSVANYSSSKYRINQSVISSIRVSITGDSGIPLDFQGLPWFLTLSITFEYKQAVIHPLPNAITGEAN